MTGGAARRGRAALAAVAAAGLAAGGCGGTRAAGEAAGPPLPLHVTVAGGGLVPHVATGFAIGPGRVLTVAHVLAGGGRVRVGGRPARVLRADPRLDLAVLAVAGLGGRAARFGAGGGRGELEVLRGGTPHALGAVVRRRVTASVDGHSRPALELAAAIEPGDSGAPLTGADGRVLGIVFARSDAGRTAWAVDSSAILDLSLSLRSTSSRRPSRRSSGS